MDKYSIIYTSQVVQDFFHHRYYAIVYVLHVKFYACQNVFANIYTDYYLITVVYSWK